MPNSTISQDILRAALNGLQLDKQRIDGQIAEVQAMLDGGSRKTTAPVSEETPRKGRGKRSAAVRRRMAEAQRLRWMKIKGESEPPSTALPEAAPPKRKKFTAATRKRMAEGQRLRYLKLKGETEPEAVSPGPATPSAPKRRQISPEGLKRIVAATKKRWRLQKAAAKAQSIPATKASRKAAVKAAKKASPAKSKKAVKKAVKKSATKTTPAPAVASAAE